MTDHRHSTRLRRGRRTWDLAAASYYGLLDLFGGRRLREMALRQLELQPGEAFLDIGCGPGLMLMAARDVLGPKAKLVGVDYSPGMLRKARRRVGQWSNVELREADASRTPLGDGEFDAAVALASFSAMPDVGAAVDLAHCALRPGGRLFVFDVRPRRRLARGIYRSTAGFSGADVLSEVRRVFDTIEVLIPERSALTMVLATRTAS